MSMDTGQIMADKMDAEMERGEAMHDEIERLRSALEYAQAGLSLAYDALEKCCFDEAMLHIGYHLAKVVKALEA